MGSVDHHQGVSAQDLHPTRHRGDRQRIPNRFFVELASQQCLGGGHRVRQIHQLISSVKGKEQVLVRVLGASDGHQPAPDSRLGVEHGEVLAIVTMMDAEITGACIGDFQREVRQWSTDQGRIGSGNCEFLPGDRGHVLAEILGVLDPDAGEDAYLGVDDVGRIETPAQAHFEHRCVDCLVGEESKGGRRGQLEVRVGLFACLGPQVGEAGHVRDGEGELLLGRHPTVDRKPLFHVLEVG